jgi:malate dehydrogenase (oxaloacetate-decarboxylating)(NADP+)
MEQRVVCVGAGSAGIGVCQLIVDAMVNMGMDEKDAMNRVYICSSKGLIGQAGGPHGDPNHGRGIQEDRKPWVRSDLPDGLPLEDLVKQVQPTVLLGLSTVPGIFTEEILREMASYCERPIIKPMSNPTSKSECTADEAFKFTDGRAIFASGSPFPPVTVNGQTFTPSQCNNMYIFPGIGLGASICGAKRITDMMMIKASIACAQSTTDEEKAAGMTLPSIRRIREVSCEVAMAVIREAVATGENRKPVPSESLETLRSYVARKMYDPTYAPLVDPRSIY